MKTFKYAHFFFQKLKIWPGCYIVVQSSSSLPDPSSASSSPSGSLSSMIRLEYIGLLLGETKLRTPGPYDKLRRTLVGTNLVGVVCWQGPTTATGKQFTRAGWFTGPSSSRKTTQRILTHLKKNIHRSIQQKHNNYKKNNRIFLYI